MVKNKEISVKKITEISPGRILLVDLEYFGFSIRCINIYASADEKVRRENFSCLKYFLPGEIPIILGGDFNCVWPGEKREKESQSTKTDYSAIILKNIIKDFDLLDVWKTIGNEREKFTWKARDNSSRFDYFFVSNKIKL